MRVIIDNDFCGDIDGVFQLVHQLLSPTAEVRGIIGSHLTGWPGYNDGDPAIRNSMNRSCEKAREVLGVMGLQEKYKVVRGAPQGLADCHIPQDSEGARLIVEEAMRTDTELPLYVVCGAGLTNIASAWLLNPAISSRLIVIWIGGQEYEGMAVPPPGAAVQEFNLALSVKAAQTVFNDSDLPVWQVPRNAYRQCILSLAEVKEEIAACGTTGAYLANELFKSLAPQRDSMGEVYIMGDSPLVLLTALQTGFEPDPASSRYVSRPAPLIADDGTCRPNPEGREIRVYDLLDTRLMFGDFIAKLKRYSKSDLR